MPNNYNICDQSLDYFDLQRLTTGESTFPRDIATNAAVSMGSSGALRLVYFTAGKTEVITQVRMVSGGTAAGATPTLVRVGVWTSDATGALLSQVAATANDTTLLAGTNTAYTKAFASSFTKTAGQRYAVGLLVVTGAAMPTMSGTTGLTTLTGQSPALSFQMSGQADLPSTAAVGSLAASGSRPYFELLP